MDKHPSSQPIEPSPPRERGDAYDVIIVKRPAGPLPTSAEDLPFTCEEVYISDRRVPAWAAVAVADGFNKAERKDPIGLWAVIRRSKG